MPTVIVNIIVFIIVALLIIYKVYLTCTREIKPGQILVVDDSSGRKFYREGRVFVVPLIQKSGMISCEPYDMSLTIRNLLTMEGVPCEAHGYARVRIGETDQDVETAADRFSDKSPTEIAVFIEEILTRDFSIHIQEYDLRSLVQNSLPLFKKVEASFREDLDKMGIRVDDFEISAFNDAQGLIERLSPHMK